MSEDILNIAIVGCGAIAERQHLPLLQARSDCRISALVERDEQRAQALAKRFGVAQTFTTVESLERVPVDAAIVALPSALHGPVGIQLLDRGIHVLMEKPLAISVGECDALLEAAERSGAVLSVGLMRRFLTSGQFAKWAIDSGTLGRLVSFEIEDGFVYKWPAASSAFISKELAGGGVLMDLGAHTIDQILWWFGEVKSFTCYDDNFAGVEADCRIELTLKSGVTGVVELSRTRDLSCSAIIRGERATLEVKLAQNATRLQFLNSAYQLSGASAPAGINNPEEQRPAQLIAAEQEDFFRAIRTGTPLTVPGSEARRSVALIESLYAARKPLELPWISVPRQWHHESSDGERNSPLKDKTILVTGATGFIGGRLIERLVLEEGAKVRALVRDYSKASRLGRFPIELVNANMADKDSVRRAVEGCDVVMHCAHETKVNRATKKLTIAEGTRNLCEAVLETGVERLVHLSTSGVYGPTLDGDLTETTPWQPSAHPYVRAKRLTEKLVLELHKSSGLPAVVLQPTVVYGPFCRPWTLAPVRELQTGLVPLVDGGTGLCNAVYVDDVIDAMYLAATQPGVEGEVFLISGEEPVTWKEFYSAFEQVLNLHSTVEITAEAIDRILAKQAKEAKPVYRFINWLRDPKVFWRVVKAPPLGYIVEGLKRVIPQPGRRAMTDRILGPKPAAARAKPSPAKELLVPNETLLALYRAHTRMRINKAKQQLGYQPHFDFEQGMVFTAEYLRWARLAPQISSATLPSSLDKEVA